MPRACPRPRGPEAGLTLLEVLVAVVVAGLLMTVLASVLSRSVRNNEALTEAVDLGRADLTLRRLLHRDLAGRVGQGAISLDQDGFNVVTAHALVAGAPVPVRAQWRMDKGRLVRTEIMDEIGWKRASRLLPELKSWRLRLYDTASGRWTDLQSWLLPGRKVDPGGLELTLEMPDGRKLVLKEALRDGFAD